MLFFGGTSFGGNQQPVVKRTCATSICIYVYGSPAGAECSKRGKDRSIAKRCEKLKMGLI